MTRRRRNEETPVMSDMEIEAIPQGREANEAEDEQILQFLDSMDTYLTLLDSLSEKLRQGWFDLASARQSMGASRVNGASLDLNVHHAATSFRVIENDVDSDLNRPHFSLCKWGSSGNEKSCSTEAKSKEDDLLNADVGQNLRNRSTPQVNDTTLAENGVTIKEDDQVSMERSKSLSTFGTLVSPKLRTAQRSFETALETLVEIVNVRSSMLNAYDQVHKESKSSD